MVPWLRVSLPILLALLLSAVTVSPAGAADPACPARFKDQPRETVACLCEAGRPQGSVYGDMTYTDDSDLCAAARHAGLLPEGQGGRVEAWSAGGCDLYPAVRRNGVASNAWGAWGRSFFFPAASDGRCAGDAPGGATCPQRFADQPAERLTCQCLGDGLNGQVFGTLIYTDDSNLCAAARHAGLLSGPGPLEAIAAPGCPAYLASERNGVASRAWSAWPRSFVFPALGPQACPG